MNNKFSRLYDFIVLLYIVFIFAFENETYAQVFKIVQFVFIAVTIVAMLVKKKIKFEFFIICQITLLVITLLTDVVLLSRSDTMTNEIYIFFQNIIKLFCIMQYCDTEERINNTILFMIIGGVIASGFVIFDYISIGQVVYDLKYASDYRIGANISGDNVNITSLNLSIAFGSAIYYIYKENRKSRNQILYLIFAIVIFMAIILTGSRKVLIFCLITFIAQMISKNRKKLLLAAVVVVIIYMALIKIDILYFYIGHKIDVFGGSDTISLYSESDMIRKNLISGGLQLFSNNLLGVGFGGVAKELGLYAHNNFVEILASVGLVGFVIYYSLYLYPLFQLRKLHIQKQLYAYFISSVLGLLVVEWFQVTYLYKIPMILLALMASYVSVKKMKGA